jgi:hypothetical protein
MTASEDNVCPCQCRFGAFGKNTARGVVTNIGDEILAKPSLTGQVKSNLLSKPATVDRSVA